jgi:hypothetical protein
MFLRESTRLGVMLLLLAGSARFQVLQGGDRTLTMKEAEQLARAALSSETKRLPGLALYADPHPLRCATFDVLWSNPGPGSVHVEFLTIDLQTAEVWSPTVWRRVTTPSLRSAQRAIRNRLHISDAEARRAVESEHIVCEN